MVRPAHARPDLALVLSPGVHHERPERRDPLAPSRAGAPALLPAVEDGGVLRFEELVELPDLLQLAADDGVLAVGQRLAPPHELLPAPVEHAAADELRHVGPERGPEVVLPLAGDADAHRQPRADQLPG